MLTDWMMKKCCEKYQTNINFIPKEIRYHGFWSTEYQTRARKTPNGKEEEMKHKEPVETNRERSLERDTERDREKCIHSFWKHKYHWYERCAMYKKY